MINVSTDTPFIQTKSDCRSTSCMRLDELQATSANIKKRKKLRQHSFINGGRNCCWCTKHKCVVFAVDKVSTSPQICQEYVSWRIQHQLPLMPLACRLLLTSHYGTVRYGTSLLTVEANFHPVPLYDFSSRVHAQNSQSQGYEHSSGLYDPPTRQSGRVGWHYHVTDVCWLPLLFLQVGIYEQLFMLLPYVLAVAKYPQTSTVPGTLISNCHFKSTISSLFYAPSKVLTVTAIYINV